ncbi:MAG: hypothetical protein COB04_07670 [Gammaproteobacteria bacterium]|nr:MAG: hypothetical protein COB04_07670 [Gammaproteobacteria bacterium]
MNHPLTLSQRQHLQAATKQRQDGNPQRAIALCQPLLAQAQTTLPALKIIADSYKDQNQPEQALLALKQRLEHAPNHHEVHSDIASQFFAMRQVKNAERHIRQALALNPLNPQAHNLLGQIMADNHYYEEAVFHWRQVFLLHEPVSTICSNMGNALVRLGELDEACDVFTMGRQLDPNDIELLLNWVKMEEARKNLPIAWELLAEAERINPNHPRVLVIRARLHFRNREYDLALPLLDSAEKLPRNRDKSYDFHFTKGDVLDAMGQYDAAMQCYARGNQLAKELDNFHYQKDSQQRLVKNLHDTFKAKTVTMPSSNTDKSWRDKFPSPIFIIGFPRSGTTLVEQILACHPEVSAGDELSYISRATALAGHMIGNGKPYPECFSDFDANANQPVMDKFRSFYLQNVQSRGIVESNSSLFTDKMPLNEVNLALIAMMFPSASIVHVIRHPLDVILSCFFNPLTHGGNCSFDLVTAAQHYALIYSLIKHYQSEFNINIHRLRYEELVANPRPITEDLLKAIDLEWDDQCLEFHNNRRYARTASYAQVTEKLYSRSKYRYKNYLPHLQPAADILKDIIKELGYEI